MNPFRIIQERPDTPEARVLIEELEDHLASLYPIQARYGLSVAGLLQENVAFFVLRYEDLPAGCGGVQCFGKTYAELKRMYVRPGYQGQGLGKKILAHLEDYALSQGIPIMRLETGVYQESAMHLYERMGYQKRPPFGNYEAGPYNLFYEKSIAQPEE